MCWPGLNKPIKKVVTATQNNIMVAARTLLLVVALASAQLLGNGDGYIRVESAFEEGRVVRSPECWEPPLDAGRRCSGDRGIAVADAATASSYAQKRESQLGIVRDGQELAQ